MKRTINIAVKSIMSLLIASLSMVAIAHNTNSYNFSSDTEFASTEGSYILLDPVGEIEGQSISKDELNAYLQIFEDLRVNEVDHPMIAEQLLKQRGGYEFLANKAKERGLDLDPDYQQRVELFSRHYLIELLHRDMLAKKEFDLGREREEYNEQIAQLERHEFNVSHILVETKETAEKIIQGINNSEIEFEQAVREYSIDTESQAKDGNFGVWFKLSLIEADFAKELQEMKSNEVSAAPLKTEYGFHILKVNGIRDVKIPTFDELDLFEIAQPAFQKYIETVQESVKVELPETK